MSYIADDRVQHTLLTTSAQVPTQATLTCTGQWYAGIPSVYIGF